MQNRGLDFLLNRGLTLETLKEFQLAYQTADGKLVGSTFPEAIKSVLSPKLNDCVLIPLHNAYGEPISVTGRRLSGEPKFCHAAGFKFHQHLYGLHKAVESMVQQDFAVLVEGPFDMLACYQAG
jgi:DNA primase